MLFFRILAKSFANIIDDQISFLYKVNDKMKIMQKSSVEDNIIKLAQNENSSLWFVVSNEIEINVSFSWLILLQILKVLKIELKAMSSG